VTLTDALGFCVHGSSHHPVTPNQGLEAYFLSARSPQTQSSEELSPKKTRQRNCLQVTVVRTAIRACAFLGLPLAVSTSLMGVEYHSVLHASLGDSCSSMSSSHLVIYSVFAVPFCAHQWTICTSSALSDVFRGALSMQSLSTSYFRTCPAKFSSVGMLRNASGDSAVAVTGSDPKRSNAPRKPYCPVLLDPDQRKATLVKFSKLLVSGNSCSRC
jgi:hypothetical protein